MSSNFFNLNESKTEVIVFRPTVVKGNTNLNLGKLTSYTKLTLLVSCVHGDVREFQLLKSGSWPPLETGHSSSDSSQSSPSHYFLGETDQGSPQPPFHRLPRADANRSHQLPNHGSRRPTWSMEKGDTRERGGIPTHSNHVSSVFHQVAQEGNFGCEQKEA